MKRFLLFFGLGVALAAVSRAQQMTANATISGTNVTATCQITFGTWQNSTGQWTVTMSTYVTGSGGTSPNLAEAEWSWAGHNQGIDKTTGGVNQQTFTVAAGYTGSATVQMGIGNISGSTQTFTGVNAPSQPAINRTCSYTTVNSFPVGMTYYLLDKTTDQAILSSAVYVQPGQSVTLTGQSNGDDLVVQANSQTLQQFLQVTGAGDGSTDANDNVIAGNANVTVSLVTIPYTTMAITPQTSSTDSTGTGAVTQTQAGTTVVNGATVTVPNSSPSAAVVNGTGVAGAGSTVVFEGGTSINQTGNTSGLTNGQYNEGVNAINAGLVKVVGAVNAVDSDVKSSGTGSSGSGTVTVNGGSVAISNLPAIQSVQIVGTSPLSVDDTAVVAAVNTVNSTLGGIATTASTISTNVASMNTNLTGAKVDLDTINTNAAAMRSDADSIKTDVHSIAGVFSPTTAFDSSGNLSSAQSAANAAVNNASWGPTLGGSGAGATVPSSLPPDIQAGSIPSGSGSGSTALAFSFVPGNQIWAGASSIMSGARPILIAVIALWFAASCGDTVGAYVRALPNTPSQGSLSGVEDFAPGVAQTKAWLSAGAVVAVVSGCVAAMVGIVDNYLGKAGYGVGSILTALDLSSLGYGVGIIDQYFPVATLCTLGILRAGLNFALIPVYSVASAVVRFLVV